MYHLRINPGVTPVILPNSDLNKYYCELPLKYNRACGCAFRDKVFSYKILRISENRRPNPLIKEFYQIKSFVDIRKKNSLELKFKNLRESCLKKFIESVVCPLPTSRPNSLTCPRSIEVLSCKLREDLSEREKPISWQIKEPSGIQPNFIRCKLKSIESDFRFILCIGSVLHLKSLELILVKLHFILEHIWNYIFSILHVSKYPKFFV